MSRPSPLLAALLLLVAAWACTEAADGGGATGEPRPEVGVEPIDEDVDELPAAAVTITTDEGEVGVAARVASTRASRQRGLMEVEELPAGTGMLFVWDGEPRTGGFWMQDTVVPLDIAFVDGDERIVAVIGMEPCEEDPCTTYDPDVPYVVALEVPGGWFADRGVRVGDRLTWTRASETG